MSKHRMTCGQNIVISGFGLPKNSVELVKCGLGMSPGVMGFTPICLTKKAHARWKDTRTVSFGRSDFESQTEFPVAGVWWIPFTTPFSSPYLLELMIGGKKVRSRRGKAFPYVYPRYEISVRLELQSASAFLFGSTARGPCPMWNLTPGLAFDIPPFIC